MGKYQRLLLTLLMPLLGLVAPARAKIEALTPGWDGFPSLTSGTVEWTTNGGDFSVTYTLHGAAPNHSYMAGLHHMDATGPIDFGDGTNVLGTTPDTITREGNTSAVLDSTFGFVTTDSNGDAVQNFEFTPTPGTYAVQFHLRDGGPPGCPVTSCNAVYRTGAIFAENLSRIVIPGAVSFWGADGTPDAGDGTPADSVGGNDLTPSGSVAYRAGHFRDGFDLNGSDAYLSVANPQAAGLASAAGFSVSAWVDQDVFSSAGSIVNLRTPSNGAGFTLEPLFATPGTMQLAVNTSGTPEDFTLLQVAGFPVGQRLWIAATYDGPTHTMRLYRNGSLVGRRFDVPGTAMNLGGTESFQIGRNIVAGFLFDGVLDDVAYFDRALSPEEMRAEGGWLFADDFEIGDTLNWSATEPPIPN